MRRLRGLLPAALFLSWLSAGAADQPPEWTTLQGNMQRTNFSPVQVEPPYRVKWVWANGDLYDAATMDPPEFAPTWMTKRMQPVTDGKLVFVGSVSDNHLYAIDIETGKTKWRYDAGGAFTEAATVHNGRVYAADLAGRLHCVDAAAGEAKWIFKDPHRGSFYTCPAVADGKVLLGSQSGWFFAVDAETGVLVWEKDFGNPVFNSPAVLGDSVFFGDEGMFAHRLRIKDGSEIWKTRLHGWTMRHSAPVVLEKRGLVVFRSSSIHNQYSGKVMDDALTLDPAKKGTQESDHWAMVYANELKTATDHPQLFNIAQEELRKLLSSEPHLRTFFLLDVETGQEPFVAPAGYAAQHGDVAIPPVAFPDGRLLSYYRGRWAAIDSVLFASRYLIDVGRLNFDTKYFERFGPFKSIPQPFMMRGDDNSRLSVGGSILYGNHGSGAQGARERSTGALDLRDFRRHALTGNDDKGAIPAADALAELQGRMGCTGNSKCAVAVSSKGILLVNRQGVAVAACESAKEDQQ